ncbi:penicillin-binding protein 1A [Halorhabdus tiamatea SARL4B]|uniref:DUF58 domain-containing protein n=1 Tax=Halorhabdus tiamatea SARL4B TaxID=1033806 RepID=F7PF41_9EURY|nr:DUF58 domain-containing protein [Halorhabdus tiamatea]ERJ06029.1 penicillin-binding protein 1A [Halorhabdus tiamatea SARL4B]CCQ34409.1 conserved hypothetical protein (DUF58) [Halorhabdus tiamatea SARL4B]
MRLTTRGRVTLAVAVAAVVMAWLFGARSLNAVAVPAVVAVVAAVAQVRLADQPSAERSNLPAGFPDETREVTVSITGSRGTIVEATDPHPAGLSSTDNTVSGSLPTTHTYELTLTERGKHEVGPLAVTLRDVFGLVTHEVTVGDPTNVLVYPAIHDVGGSTVLTAELERARRPERQEIDQLREYVPGDRLRDIDWKSSAKRLPDLIVTEFVGREVTGAIRIAVSADRDTADATASAVASVALFFARAGLEVGVHTPDGALEPAQGVAHRTELLGLLAETGAGTVSEQTWADADVRVAGEDGTVTLDVDGRNSTFEEIRAGDGRDGNTVASLESERTEVTTA